MAAITVVRSFFALAVFVGLSLLAGVPGMVFQPGAWYEALSKPSWVPPEWLFPLVWTTLYVLMGVAAWLVWQGAGLGAAAGALGLFALQLLANATWSWIFFGWHRIGLALIDAGLLLILILATMLAFRRYSVAAAGLMLLYALWVAFATALNLSIWLRNR